MVAIELEDIIGPCLITIAGSFQMLQFTKAVGRARRKFKVSPPATTGDEGFVRVYRAHQNCSEQYPVFLGGMWACSLLTHQGVGVVLGIIYLIGRKKYFDAYSEKTSARLRPFFVAMYSLAGMLVAGSLGLANFALVKMTGKGFKKMILG